MLTFGDWWQLGPVRAAAIFGNPSLKYEDVEQKVLSMFLNKKDVDGFHRLFELTHAYRFDKDPWLKQVLTEHRHGEEAWKTYCFMHGLPTRNPGTWLAAAADPTCGSEDCATLATTRWPELQAQRVPQKESPDVE